MKTHRLQQPGLFDLGLVPRRIPQPTVSEKACARCGETKPASEFHIDPAKSTNLASWCRPCVVAGNRKNYQENYEARSAYGKVYAEIHRERIRRSRKGFREANKDKLREAYHAWMRENPEAKKASDRKTYLKNREKRIAQATTWAKANRDKVREYQRLTEFRRRNGERVDELGREYIAILLGDPCVYCGSGAGTIDHIVPLAAGSDSDWTNLAAACSRCNARKQAKPLLRHLLQECR